MTRSAHRIGERDEGALDSLPPTTTLPGADCAIAGLFDGTTPGREVS
jgi:hypothetical protein